MRLLSRFALRRAPRRTRIVYASDLHGNQRQYSIVLEFAKDVRADAVIFGGDNAPKSIGKRSPARQLRFFQKGFYAQFSEFAKHSPRTRLFMIYGNDDFKSYKNALHQIAEKLGVTLLSNDLVDFNEHLQIIGYSYVPMTPFRFKDWEKVDVLDRKRLEAREHGIVSHADGFRDVGIDDIRARGTIEDDLSRHFARATKPTILVAHAPPAESSLDMIGAGRHVGSWGVRRAIEQNAPLLSLHGHIHESQEQSGKYAEIIGQTVSVNPGHFFNRRETTLVLIDLVDGKPQERLRNILRIKVSDHAQARQLARTHDFSQLAKSDHTLPAL